MEFKQPNKKYSNPFIKYGSCIIEKVESEIYPGLVMITKTTKGASHLLNKKYITLEFGVKAIDKYLAEKTIERGKNVVWDELADLGLDADDSIDNDE